MLGVVLETDLTYDIVGETVDRRIDDLGVSALVVIGGRAGSKARNAVNLCFAKEPLPEWR